MVAYPVAVQGAVTHLSGPPKEAGKTTLTLALCKAVSEGTPFFGRPTVKTPIVYLTEENIHTFRRALKQAGLLESDMRLLHWDEHFDLPWAEAISGAISKAIEVGAKLLVVDTLGPWAGLRGKTRASPAPRAR